MTQVSAPAATLAWVVLALVAPARYPVTLCPSTPCLLQPSTSLGSSAYQLRPQLHFFQLHFIGVDLILQKRGSPGPPRGAGECLGYPCAGGSVTDEQWHQLRASVLLETLVGLIHESWRQPGQGETVPGGNAEIKPMGPRKRGRERLNGVERGFHAHLQLSEAGRDVLMYVGTYPASGMPGWHLWASRAQPCLCFVDEYPAVLTL